MRKFIVLTGLAFLYIIYGIYLAQYNVQIFPEELVAEPPRGFFDYKGVTNVHTQMSSGSGDLAKVMAAAQESGLDFISITDLNLFEKPSALVGYHAGLLVMIDGEYSYLNSRLLNIGASTSRHLQGVGRSQVLFADLLSQNSRDPDVGILVLAHPMRERYRWTGEYPVGLDGLEIVNLKSMWEGAWIKNKISAIFSLLEFPFNEELALLRLFEEPEDELRLWDQLNSKRRVIGIAGAGADSKVVIGKARWRFPSYQTLFSIVRNHVVLRSEMTGSAAGDLDKLSHALREGHFYMSLDILGNPKGFNALIRQPKGGTFLMGSHLDYESGLSLEVHLPQTPVVPFETVIFRNGERIHVSNQKLTHYALVQPGVYRVVVRVIPTLPLPDGKKWIPWIYTNPFYVGASGLEALGKRTSKPGEGGS